MEVPDSIEREVILPVPPTRVWTALTQPDQLSAWLGTAATIDLRPGGEVIFRWDRGWFAVVPSNAREIEDRSEVSS